jgi:hypothetical protein
MVEPPATILPRFSFFHWVLVDLPASTSSLPAGWGSDGIQAGGKPGPAAPLGRHGVNDYGVWFAGDARPRGMGPALTRISGGAWAPARAAGDKGWAQLRLGLVPGGGGG